MIEYKYDVDPQLFEITDVGPNYIISQLLEKYIELGGDVTNFVITAQPSPAHAAIKGIRYKIVSLELCGDIHPRITAFGPCIWLHEHTSFHMDKNGARWY